MKLSLIKRVILAIYSNIILLANIFRENTSLWQAHINFLHRYFLIHYRAPSSENLARFRLVLMLPDT